MADNSPVTPDKPAPGGVQDHTRPSLLDRVAGMVPAIAAMRPIAAEMHKVAGSK